MRAEMTVGLDLRSLENLRIVNGYGDVKRERKLSLEGPSSPEESLSKYESDSGQQDVSSSSSVTTRTRTKQKCGRPANPIPRHKRDSHIKAEYKRRDKIQKGFDTLMSMVPALSDTLSGKESRSSMLFKTAEYCRRLKSECGSAQTEITALRQELEALGSEIHDLQELLPQHGSRHVEEKELSMDAMYNQYMVEQTKRDWKFWVFGFFMRPLYDSYKETVSHTQKPEEFNQTVMEWVQERLSLKTLRKGFLDSLRYISKHTGIMTTPENLQQEAAGKVHQHFLDTQSPQYEQVGMSLVSNQSPNQHYDQPSPKFSSQPPTPQMTAPPSPRVTTPVGTPRVVTPVPGSHHPSVSSTPRSTPLPTPTASPPRTPVVGRRSMKRDSVRSTESRSRSNSPESVEIKNKRRTSYRSRSGKRSPSGSVSDNEKMGLPQTPTQAQLAFNTYLANQHCGQQQQPSAQQSIAMVTEASVSQSTATSQAEKLVATTVASMDDKAITSFVESLINAMKPHSGVTSYVPMVTQPSTVQASAYTQNNTSNRSCENLYPARPQNGYVKSNESQFSPGSTSETISMEQQQEDSIDSCQHASSFVPLEKSSVISEGVVMNMDRAVGSTNTFHDSLLSGILSMDTEYSNSDSLTEMQPYNGGQSGSLSKSSSECSVYNQGQSGSTGLCDSAPGTGSTENECKNVCHPMNTDDDSLMNFLKVDVMDMGAMMEFLKPDDQIL